MEFSRFCLGLRFVIRPEGKEATEHAAWKLIFSALSPKDAFGLELHGLWMSADHAHPQAYYLCALSGLSLGRIRRVYARLAVNPLILSQLDLFEPIIQLNQMSILNGFTYLGRADAAGKVSGGDCLYGSMQFHGKDVKKSIFKKRAPIVLLAFQQMQTFLNAEDSLRTVMQTLGELDISAKCIPLPIEQKATDTIKNMIPALGGRYDLSKFSQNVPSEQLLYTGILPDLTVAIAAVDAESALTCIMNAYAQGYRKFIVGTSQHVDSEMRQLFLKINTEELPEAKIHLLDHTVSAEQYFSLLACKRYLRKAKTVIYAGSNGEENALEGALKKNLKGVTPKFIRLAVDIDAVKTESEAMDSLQNTAKKIQI